MSTTLSLADFQEASVRDQRTRCKIGRALDQLKTKQLRAVFEQAIEALGDPESGIKQGAILAQFEAQEIDVNGLGTANFTQHRKKKCTCFRKLNSSIYAPRKR